ncbi:MAG TPA: ABC transporter substrate-binding protein [Lacipirellulaceae bacterium]|jgi:peptide/nickel transport system substrate-binding protein
MMNCHVGSRFWRSLLCLASVGLAIVTGCSSSEEHTRDAGKTDHQAATASADAKPGGSDDAAANAASTPFKLGDLIEPFTPPPLAEVDKVAEWIDQPVLDSMDILRKKQAKLGGPPVTVEQALALRNDSDENNAKILDTLGRLAPADGKGVNYDATWVRQVGGDLKSTNPLLQSSITEAEYQALTGFGYLGDDQDVNHIATNDSIVSWQTSKDRMMDKFVLRDDLLWSDGQPITAHDVKFSYLVIMTSAVPITAVRTGIDQLKWVEAYDDHTLVFFHKEPLATNVVNMSVPTIPKHIYEKSIADDPTMARSPYHTKLEDDPVVGGPYKLTKRARSQEFVLERRDDYYRVNGRDVRDKPLIKEIRTKVIEDQNTALLAQVKGDIQEMELRAEEWASKTNGDDFYERNTKVRATEWTEFHFDWNLKSPYFSDKRVRQAMSYAFDYHEFLHTISHDVYTPCAGIYHPTSWMFPKDGPQPYQQDLNKAEDLLDEAGWKDTDGDGIRDKEIDGKRVPFRFTLYTYQSESGMQAATLMKTCLEKIGITCYVKPTEFAELIDTMEKHKFDAAMGGWSAGSDPDSESNIWGKDGGRNFVGYSNPRVDELFVKGRHEFDRDKRAAIYGEIHKLIWEDQPDTWLFNRNAMYAFNKSLRGYNFSPLGPFIFSPGFGSIYKAAAP